MRFWRAQNTTVMDSKKVYVCSLPLTPEVILSFVSSQVASLMQQSYKEQSYKKDEPYVTSMLPLVIILYMNARSYVDLGLPLPPVVNFLPAMTKNVRIYVETAIVVVISYVSLLVISWSYIWLVLFPIIAIGFIVALCNELSHQEHQGGSQEQSNQGEQGKETTAAPAAGEEKTEGLEAVALLPYWALCMMGQSFQADKFAVSQFLLFLSFMLGALTMMMNRLVGLAAATTAHRGVAAASELLRKASLVVLLVAVHAVAAELLGENALLFCLPEIVPVLLWLSVRLDCGGGGAVTAAAIDRINLYLGSRRVLALLGAALAAVLAMLAAGYMDMDESVLYWCGKALVSCAVSAPLTFYLVFMLCQWPPGGQPSLQLQEAVDLLSVWAKVLLIAVVTLLVFTSLASVQLVLLHEPVASASADQILQRLYQKFLQFII